MKTYKITKTFFTLVTAYMALQFSAALAQDTQIEALSERVAQLQNELVLLEDQREIEILQRTYGYYVDKNLWVQISDLFTEDGTLEIGGRGIFVGKARVLEYLQWLGEPVHGRLYDHTQMQALVNVSPSGETAKGRWRAMVFGGDYERSSIFGDVIYENEYRKEDGIWKISKLHAYFIMYSNMEEGWETYAIPNTRPEVVIPPDLPPTIVHDMYPGTLVAPMHYQNPVTGGPVFSDAPAPLSIDAKTEDSISLSLADLNRRAGLLKGIQSVEKLQNAFGYYFDKRQWDQVTDLFAQDGTIERGQRGIYRGTERIRQSLDLYGEAGLKQGNVNNHLLYQPVIHIADDGQSAKARVRSFDMLGDYQGDAIISGGVFENEYVKDNGIWKIKSDHFYTTFVADYTVGWAHGSMPVPQQSVTLPPDSPPSEIYEAFPDFNLVPFHYNNPVTGAEPYGNE